MNQIPKNFCIAPFIQITMRPEGYFGPCPCAEMWEDPSAKVLDFWQGDGFEKLRNSFIADQRPVECSRCWDEEASGIKSLRLHLYDPVAGKSAWDLNIVPEEQLTDWIKETVNSKSYLKGPKFLTSKNGNLCNAKCRTCHPKDSSPWVADVKKLGGSTYQIFPTTNWSDDQLEDFVNISSNLIRLEMYGGESLYNKRVFNLLERLIERDFAKDIVLYFNTNGSIFPEKHLDIFKNFKSVELGISIDAVGDKFSYVRHPLSYTELEQNINSWRKFFEENNVKYHMQCITTVSILNIWDLPEIHNEVVRLLNRPPFWILLARPKFYAIKNIPDKVKPLIKEKLLSSLNSPQIESLINFMMQPSDNKDWEEFKNITKKIDSIREESFEQTFPEFSKVLNENS